MEKDLKVDFMRYTLSVLALILLASCVSIKETDVAYEERKGYILVVDDTISQIEYKNGAFLLYSPSIGISGEVLSHSYSGKCHYFWSTKYGINIVMLLGLGGACRQQCAGQSDGQNAFHAFCCLLKRLVFHGL